MDIDFRHRSKAGAVCTAGSIVELAELEPACDEAALASFMANGRGCRETSTNFLGKFQRQILISGTKSDVSDRFQLSHHRSLNLCVSALAPRPPFNCSISVFPPSVSHSLFRVLDSTGSQDTIERSVLDIPFTVLGGAPDRSTDFVVNTWTPQHISCIASFHKGVKPHVKKLQHGYVSYHLSTYADLILIDPDQVSQRRVVCLGRFWRVCESS